MVLEAFALVELPLQLALLLDILAKLVCTQNILRQDYRQLKQTSTAADSSVSSCNSLLFLTAPTAGERIIDNASDVDIS